MLLNGIAYLNQYYLLKFTICALSIILLSKNTYRSTLIEVHSMENTVVKVVRLVGPKMAYTSKEFLQDRASQLTFIAWDG